MFVTCLFLTRNGTGVLFIPILTMVVLQDSQMEQVVVMSRLMDQGIIQAMKAICRKSMLHSLLVAVGKFNTATEFAKSVTVFDAIWWISSAWNNVGEETILKCFRRADFVSPETDLQEKEDSTSESDLVSALPEALQFEVASEDDILESEANIALHENIVSTADGILEGIMMGRVQGAPLDDEHEVEEEEVDQQPPN